MKSISAARGVGGGDGDGGLTRVIEGALEGPVPVWTADSVMFEVEAEIVTEGDWDWDWGLMMTDAVDRLRKLSVRCVRRIFQGFDEFRK